MNKRAEAIAQIAANMPARPGGPTSRDLLEALGRAYDAGVREHLLAEADLVAARADGRMTATEVGLRRQAAGLEAP